MTDKCCPPIEEPAVPNVQPVEWCAGNRVLRWESGRITERPRPDPIPDAVYTNATIRTEDGCIAEISEGDAVVYSACDPCAVPPPANGGNAEVRLSGESCNLATFDAGGALLVQIYPASSDCISLQGCGTYYSPLIGSIIRSTDPSNILECRSNGLYVPASSGPGGVNFTGCGIVIDNGLWTQIPLPFQPLQALTSDDGSVVLTRSLDGCSFNLSVATPTPDISVPVAVINTYTSSGALPATPSPGETFAAVGAANPRQLWCFILNVGWREILDSGSSSLQVNL